MTTKVRARDEEGRIMKAKEPNPSEMIDPFVYKATGRAVNYDRRWVGTMKVGDTVGAWATTPWNRPHGEKCRELQEKMKASGQIKWDEDAFYFTHATGVRAREHYEQRVLDGELKANKKSWENKHAGFTGVTFEELEKKFPDLYKKATATYINKEKALELLAEARDDLIKDGHDEEDITVEMLAQATPLTEERITKLLAVDDDEEVTEEVVEVAEPDLGFDENTADPSDEEILANTEIEDDEDSEVVAELDEEPQEKAETVAQVTATETAADIDFDLDDQDNEGHSEIKELTAHVFSDASCERIDVKAESVGWRTSDKTEDTAYLVEVPDYREEWLREGRNGVFDPESGRQWIVNVVIGETVA